MSYIIYIVIGILLLWTLWGYFSSRVESLEYSVIESKKQYEIRLYPEHIVAQATVKDQKENSLNSGFRIVAGYIFGGNVKKEKIAMTTPVVTDTEGEYRTISFSMPKNYNRDTLPATEDSRVKINIIPERKVAALRFGWIRTEENIQKKKKELIQALEKDNISYIGTVQYAGYNDPWTPPWMTRNEVFVVVS